MRSLFAYSLLAVQLVLVHFVAALPPITTYAIGSLKTDFWLSKHGIQPGAVIRTTPGTNNHAPVDAVFLRVTPHPNPVQVTTSNFFDPKTGLYVGLEEPVVPGSRLKWVKKKYDWEIANLGSYVIYPLGQDYYWFDNFSTPAVVEVEHGRNIQDGDFYWQFQAHH